MVLNLQTSNTNFLCWEKRREKYEELVGKRQNGEIWRSCSEKITPQLYTCPPEIDSEDELNTYHMKASTRIKLRFCITRVKPFPESPRLSCGEGYEPSRSHQAIPQ